MAYTAILALTHGDRTTIVHLCKTGEHVFFSPFNRNTLIFRTSHETIAALYKHGFGPRVGQPKPGYIKGSTVQYRHLVVSPDRVQLPCHWEDEDLPSPKIKGVTKQYQRQSPHRLASLALARRRKAALAATLKEETRCSNS